MTRNWPLWSVFVGIGLALLSSQDETRQLGSVTSQTTARPIGLRVQLDRAEAVYVRGEQLRLTAESDRPAIIALWELAPDGKLARVLGDRTLSVAPDRPLRLSFLLDDVPGVCEIHVIATTQSTGGRSMVEADDSRPGSDKRQEVRLRYRVVSP